MRRTLIGAGLVLGALLALGYTVGLGVYAVASTAPTLVVELSGLENRPSGRGDPALERLREHGLGRQGPRRPGRK